MNCNLLSPVASLMYIHHTKVEKQSCTNHQSNRSEKLYDWEMEKARRNGSIAGQLSGTGEVKRYKGKGKERVS